MSNAEAWLEQLSLRDDEVEDFRLWWDSRHGQYKGMISRQSLIDFLQERVLALGREQEQLYHAAEKATDLKDEFWQEYSNGLAKQLAFREVAEWARAQVERGEVDKD